MSSPKIAQKSPYLVDAEVKTYVWCACGESKNQPYCDGSHVGTEFTPKIVKIEAEKKVAFCGCKHSANGAFCDGTHAKL
jgi:CDGSH-type Zn-finger protein